MRGRRTFHGAVGRVLVLIVADGCARDFDDAAEVLQALPRVGEPQAPAGLVRVAQQRF